MQGRTYTLLCTQLCARSDLRREMWRGFVSSVRSGAPTGSVKGPSWGWPPPSRRPQVAVRTTTDDQCAESKLVSEPLAALDQGLGPG